MEGDWLSSQTAIRGPVEYTFHYVETKMYYVLYMLVTSNSKILIEQYAFLERSLDHSPVIVDLVDLTTSTLIRKKFHP